MPKVERSAVIAVAAEVAFDFVADPRNALRWMHNFLRFDPVLPGPVQVGSRVNAAGSVMGFPITTELEVIEIERPTRLTSRTTGRIKSTSTWAFEEVQGGTRVSFVGDYDLPGTLTRLVGGSFVQRELDTNAEMSLVKLKRALEGAA
jgi:carbon monoxide dehydrogenase subunit G